VQKYVGIENVLVMTKPERIPLRTLLETPRNGNKLKRIADAVKRGAVFVYPTDTIYGLGGAFNIPRMKEAILQAKQRSSQQPLICIAPDRSFFSKMHIIFPPAAERLAQAFWPGKLTLVLPSYEESDRCAIRVSRHPFITALFRLIDTPLFSTSANRSGEAYINDPDAIFSFFCGAIDFMIDAGPLPPSSPSTVVAVDHNNTVSVQREGAISSERVFEALR
jgi:L-threonylcarbamoyladenylate synthase